MGKLALGLSIICFAIAILFLFLMKAVGLVRSDELMLLKRIVTQDNNRRFKKERGGDTRLR